MANLGPKILGIVSETVYNFRKIGLISMANQITLTAKYIDPWNVETSVLIYKRNTKLLHTTVLIFLM